jgi:hypothetical protein
MEENKQVVAEWKQQNQDRLKEIKTFNPDLYSAINMALSYLNKTLTGEELPVEVEETIVEPQQQQELSVLDVACISTLSDFYDTKIRIKNEEESKKFQQLIFDLGGSWEGGSKYLDALNEKYYYVNKNGEITFGTTEEYFNDENSKEIFYDDIFKVKQTPSLKPETSEWRLKTKQELESEFGTDFDRFSIAESEMSKWYGKNLADIYTAYKYADIKEAEDSLLITDNIELGDSGFSLPIRYFTKSVSTSSQTNAYKLPIDTYPVTLKNNYSFFVANDGSRPSPTQSAGELKRSVMPMGADEIQEIRTTKFRGNDYDWYEINVGKGGTWTWKKLDYIDNTYTQKMFNKATSSTNTQPTSTTTLAQPQQSQFSYSDLVGRQLNWNGNVYDITKLRKTNPKNIVYDFKNSAGGVEPISVPKHTVEALLLGTRLVKGITLLPKKEETKKYDYSTMSDIELSKLREDTAEARDAFEFDDPEYTELSTQVGLMIDEMMRRNIL